MGALLHTAGGTGADPGGHAEFEPSIPAGAQLEAAFCGSAGAGLPTVALVAARAYLRRMACVALHPDILRRARIHCDVAVCGCYTSASGAVA